MDPIKLGLCGCSAVGVLVIPKNGLAGSMSWRFPVSCLDLLSSPLMCADATLQFQSMRFSSRYTERSRTDEYLQCFLMLGSLLFLLEFYHGQFCCLAEGMCGLICDLAVNFKTLFASSVIYYSVCLLFVICYL